MRLETAFLVFSSINAGVTVACFFRYAFVIYTTATTSSATNESCLMIQLSYVEPVVLSAALDPYGKIAISLVRAQPFRTK